MKGHRKTPPKNKGKAKPTMADTLSAISKKAKSTSPKPRFKTDTDIAGGVYRERELQRWVPDEVGTETDLSLDGSGEWDQFKANKEKFGVESTYDEHLYTTRIDTSAPDYAERVARADRLAREIEGQASGNRHILEERGLAVDDSGLDEEDKYSGVARDTRGIELMAALRGLERDKEEREKREENKENKDKEIKDNTKDKEIKDHTKDKEIKDNKEKTKDSFRLNAQSEINSLREFSANFKIPHKMPNDLLPILAKDKLKQDEILKKQQPKKKTGKAFKPNPKAAAFTPAAPAAPQYARTQSSPRAANSRAYPGGSASFKKHHQIPAADFFGGRVPTAESQREKTHNFRVAFSLFATVKKAGTVPDKPFKTPPTWDFSVDEGHEALFPPLKGYGVMMPVPQMVIPGSPFGPTPMLQPSAKYSPSMSPQGQNPPMAQPFMMYQFPMGQPPMYPEFIPQGFYQGGGSPVMGYYGYGRRYKRQ